MTQVEYIERLIQLGCFDYFGLGTGIAEAERALDVAIRIDAGATAVIHPGGSKRDDQSRELAESRGMAMVITGRRHFRH